MSWLLLSRLKWRIGLKWGAWHAFFGWLNLGQNAILKIKTAKIMYFLRFSIARSQSNLRKITRYFNKLEAGSQKYRRKCFYKLLSCLACSQNWLNICVNDHHFVFGFVFDDGQPMDVKLYSKFLSSCFCWHIYSTFGKLCSRSFIHWLLKKSEGCEIGQISIGGMGESEKTITKYFIFMFIHNQSIKVCMAQ